MDKNVEDGLFTERDIRFIEQDLRAKRLVGIDSYHVRCVHSLKVDDLFQSTSLRYLGPASDVHLPASLHFAARLVNGTVMLESLANQLLVPALATESAN